MPTAPGPATNGHVVLGIQWTPGYDPSTWTCDAPRPAGCQGTDWPPLTSWERYAAERRGGVRVPPSVSVWREQDVRRQAAVEREARGQAPEQPRVVAWGPSCEDERPAHRIGVRS